MKQSSFDVLLRRTCHKFKEMSKDQLADFSFTVAKCANYYYFLQKPRRDLLPKRSRVAQNIGIMLVLNIFGLFFALFVGCLVSQQFAYWILILIMAVVFNSIVWDNISGAKT